MDVVSFKTPCIKYLRLHIIRLHCIHRVHVKWPMSTDVARSMVCMSV